MAVYESPVPDGVNGIGFNDIIGIIPDIVFSRPSSIRLDWTSGNGGVLVGHSDSANPAIGVVSRLELTSSPIGPIPSNQNQGGFIQPPTFRQKEWTVTRTFGGQAALLAGRGLSGGSVVDFAYDDLFNYGAAPGQITQFNQTVAPSTFGHSQKAALHTVGGTNLPPIVPQLIFIGLSDAGLVDVFELGTGTKVASIPAPGIRTVSSYWRQ